MKFPLLVVVEKLPKCDAGLHRPPSRLCEGPKAVPHFVLPYSDGREVLLRLLVGLDGAEVVHPACIADMFNSYNKVQKTEESNLLYM